MVRPAVFQRYLAAAALASVVALAAAERKGPSKDFHQHRIVRPRLFQTGSKRSLETTRRTKVEEAVDDRRHLDDVTVEFEADNRQPIALDLRLNRELVPDGYFQKFHRKGKHVVQRPKPHEVELCHYVGKIRGVADSWAAVSTCDGIHGVVHDGVDMWHLEKVAGERANGSHYMYNHNHKSGNHSCGFHDDTPRHRRDIAQTKKNNNKMGSNRSVRVNIQGPWNANKRSRYVELLLVVDNQEFLDHKSDLDKVFKICKDVANVMNALYSPLNIYIALVGVVVWTEYDEITLSTNADTTLTNFLHYRRERLVKKYPNDNAQLLTGVHFEGGVVGKALKGPICTYEFSGGVNMWHSDVVGLVATTVAHEMGHNFGMQHDTEECECPDDRCIMAPASSTMKPTFWSSCSLEYLTLAFEHGMDYCLRNKPTTLFDSPICGNGFVEPGEQCDCGLKPHCDNPCCNSDTCTLFSNATCATGECCDFSTCQPKAPGSQCRPSEHECDLPEYCDGVGEFCPQDSYKVDGTSCKVGQAFCYRGSCRTHSDQCKLLWGPSGKKSDNKCYEQNRKGTKHGNCGYNRLNSTYIQCEEEDVRCGILHCEHLNERLEFGMESVAILFHSYINSGGRIIPCRTALVDLGLNDVDPGLAPEGAKCDEDSLCVNRKCMPVASLTVGPMACPDNCNGNGMCNSKGHCHCDTGYAPPLCLAPGPGGSLDSGPASNPDDSSALLTFLYVCLFIVPIVVVLCLFVYFRRRGDDWKLLVDKARPDKKKKEVSVPDNNRGVGVVGGPSGASSPSHALLPHIDSSTSALSSTVVSERTQNYEEGGLRGSIFGSFAASLSRKSTDEGSLEGRASRGKSFIQNLAKSISLPSPKMKTQSGSAAKYEIKVEHQVPRCEQPELELAGDSSSAATPTKEEEKVDLTVSVVTNSSSGGSNNKVPMTGSQSLTTFASRPVRSTLLPLSSSFRTSLPTSTVVDIDIKPKAAAAAAAEKVIKDIKEEVEVVVKPTSNDTAKAVAQIVMERASYTSDPKLAFPHSSSFAGRSAFPKTTIPSRSTSLHSTTTANSTTTTAAVVASSSNISPGNKKEPLTTKKPPPPPPKPTSLLHQHTIKQHDDEIESKAVVVKKSESLSQFKSLEEAVVSSASDSNLKMPLLSSKTSTLPLSSSSNVAKSLPKSSTLPLVPNARPVIGKPVLQNATPSAASLISKSHSTGVSQSSILSGKGSTEKIAKDRASRGVVFCDPLTLPSPTNPNNPPIIHQQNRKPLSPTSTTATTSPPPPSTTTTTTSQSTVITPTWSHVEAKPLATDVILCHIDDTDSSSDGASPKKNAPIASPESDKVDNNKVKAKLKSKFPSKKQETTAGVPPSPTKSEPPPRPERGHLRGLQISNPILQTNVAIKADLLPVCRAEDVDVPNVGPANSTAPSSEQRTGSPLPVRVAPPPPASSSPVHSGAKLKSKAPQPPISSSSSSSSVPWRSDKPASKSSERRDSAPVVETAKQKDGPKKAKSNTSKRPASIATTRPVRPSAPPPRPPPSKPGSSSPTKSDTSSVDSVVLLKKPAVEHIYDTIKESPEKEVTSPLSLDLFDTPLSSPIIARRSPDTLSTASSSDGDLMKEILKEMDKTKQEEDPMYDTLMRKGKKKKK